MCHSRDNFVAKTSDDENNSSQTQGGADLVERSRQIVGGSLVISRRPKGGTVVLDVIEFRYSCSWEKAQTHGIRSSIQALLLAVVNDRNPG